MNHQYDLIEPERYEFRETPRYTFRLTRRAFVQVVGTGIVVTWAASKATGQRGEGGARAEDPSARFHIGKDGIITAGTSKVEVGQGARTQITQAVAEEFRVPMEQVRLVMADTSWVPNDGGTFGSRTTPATIPTVRRAAASAREALVTLACELWGVDRAGAKFENGAVVHENGKRATLAELATATADLAGGISAKADARAEASPREDWKVLGVSHAPLNGRAIVTGKHEYPSDIRRPGMLYGKVLRAPSYGAKLVSIDLSPAEKMEGVVAVHDGDFVGCAAPTTYAAQKALDAVAATAKWETAPLPSSDELFAYLKAHTREGDGRGRSRDSVQGDVDGAIAAAAEVLRAEFHIPYIQHCPMEPRAACAEWDGDKLTVWTGSQRPDGVQGELAQAFGISRDNVRVIIPDTGGGFGGKHTGDAAVEAARLARAAKKPVAVRWTREEEFTWAYFRPAGVIECAGALDKDGKVTAFSFTNYNSGASGLGNPYAFPASRTSFKMCESPMREGSYRALASTANNFAREVFIDRLARAVKMDPLAFRSAHLEAGRLRGILEATAARFGWAEKMKQRGEGIGYGIACGTEKASYVATCAEVWVNPAKNRYEIRNICVGFECGAIQNPAGLDAQVVGSVVMGLGAILGEEMQFRDGKLLNGTFERYAVPRFKDVPPIDVLLLDRPELPSVGSGETPIIGVAPAVANAITNACGVEISALPIRLA